MLETAVAPAHEFILDNGLKVVFVPHAAAPVATFMVVYRVGARNEAVGYTGSSHLLEHMLFKGTPKNNRRNGRAFADIMNEIGASKNATTWIDRTNYFETVPSGYLEFAIELEADRMRGAFVADEDRRAEMTVVRNELERNDNNPARVLNSALVATAFREHPYHHPTIGWRSDVEGVSTDRLRELYDTFYHPDNATAFVVGDFDAARTRDAIERFFGSLPRATRPIPGVHTEEPPQAGERSVTLKRPGETTMVGYAFHTPAAYGQHGVLSDAELATRAGGSYESDDPVLDVLARIVGRGRTSRLARALVDTGLALEASAWNWGSRDPGLFQISVNCVPGTAHAAVRTEIDRVLEELASTGPDAAEVERAQTQLVVARAFSGDGTYGVAQRLGEYEAVGGWRLDETSVARVRAVTAQDDRAAARRYLHDDNRTVGLLVPGTPKTFERVAFEGVDVRPDVVPSLEAAPLPPPARTVSAAFASRVARGAIANGVAWRYVAAPESPLVHVRGILDAGPAFAAGRPLLAAVCAEMLSRGTRARSRIQIDEALERAGIRRSYFVDDDPSSSYDPIAFRFVAACTPSEVSAMFATLAEELSEPAFDADELALVKADLMGSLRLARTNTSWRAIQRFLELAYDPGDAHAGSDVDELLRQADAIETADVRAYFERIVLRATPLLSGAGALDAGAFAEVASDAFGRIPFVPQTRPTRAGGARAAREVRADVELERKANVDIVIGRATSLVRSDPDYLAAAVANGILGQSTLSSRLGLRLRDREGLTYGVTSAFLSAGRRPGPWRIAVSVNPANVERAIASARDVLREFAASGPTPREIAGQRNSMAGQQHVALATSGGIAAQLERLAYFGLDDDYVDTYRERLDAVTHEDVATAIARYIDERETIVVAAGTLRA